VRRSNQSRAENKGFSRLLENRLASSVVVIGPALLCRVAFGLGADRIQIGLTIKEIVD
jgi:hypothetical protein